MHGPAKLTLEIFLRRWHALVGTFRKRIHHEKTRLGNTCYFRNYVRLYTGIQRG